MLFLLLVYKFKSSRKEIVKYHKVVKYHIPPIQFSPKFNYTKPGHDEKLKLD